MIKQSKIRPGGKILGLWMFLGFTASIFLSYQPAYATDQQEVKQDLQEVTVSGKVTSETGEELPGVNVVEKGTTNGTVTDVFGNYTLTVSDDATLVYSSVGYTSEEIQVGNQSEINVTMIEDVKQLEELVVVGYGTQKKSLVTGSISKISAEDLDQGKNLRVEQALQGKSAGVLIMNNSGQPGSNVTVRIRGVGTNGDPDPLFIVDGLPMEKEGIDYLNPSDIESIEILKDAASTAIYGTRGANGVVLISTKKGKKGQDFQVTYDGYYGVQSPWRELDMLNTEQYIDVINEAALNAGQPVRFPQSMTDTLTANTDWQDQMFYQGAPKTSHTLSFTGGSENSSYSSSLSYYSQDGIVAEGNSKFERFTYRLNTLRSFGKLDIGSNLTFANINRKGISPNDMFAGTSLIQALNMPPIVPVQFDNGTWATPEDFGIGIQEITNPIAMLSYLQSNSITNKVIGNVYGEYSILDNLKLRSSFGTEYAFVNNNEYFPQYYLDATHNTNIDQIQKVSNKYVRWNLDNTLTYNNTFGLHNLSVMLGNTLFKETAETVAGRKGDVVLDGLDYAYLDNAQDPESAQAWGGFSEHTLMSYFGRVNYSFDDKYMMTAILRADGSSRFGPNNKFGYFPALSAGWVLSRENFLQNLPQISFLKLRASWGQNGSENISNFAYVSQISTGNIYYFGLDEMQFNGAKPSRIANPNLRWETSQQVDIGFDLGLWDDKLTMTVDWYNKTTKDWLVTAPAPLMVGNSAPIINGGEITNKGIELELGYKTRVNEDLSFDLRLTSAYNKNEVQDIENTEKVLSGGEGGFGQAGILRAEVGKPMGYFYGYKTDGIFQSEDQVSQYVNEEGDLIQPNAAPGDFKFVDLNGDGKLSDKDRTMLGNPYPDLTSGFNFTMNWKGFDFNMFWYGAIGHQIWMGTRRYDMNYTNYTTDVLNRWTEQNPVNDYPRVTLADLNQNWKRPSEFFVEDADYLRLRNITLGYTLPASLTDNIRLGKIKVYITAENLLTFTKYPGLEPEIGGGVFDIGIDQGIYPNATTLIGGLNVTF
ncbi:MAG: SusC/RagA family TonB-linked outer membrane protein [Candidatus Cyclobacteriaceae bacterium M3_2C_046]